MGGGGGEEKKRISWVAFHFDYLGTDPFFGIVGQDRRPALKFASCTNSVMHK